MRKLIAVAGLFLLAGCQVMQERPIGDVTPKEYPAPVEGDYVVKGYKFRSGQTLDVKMHYRTFGTLRTNADGSTNAVLIMHGTGGNGAGFLVPNFAGTLFGKGQLLDAEKYFVIIPDDVGHGKSTKPSDGLKAGFPNYGYEDMVELEYRLVAEGLGAKHLRLVMGTSMGGMHTWLWAQRYPDFMDAAMPLASLPDVISGRNRVWRKLIIDGFRTDPEWNGGNYTTQPRSLRFALGISYFMAENPYRRWVQAPTTEKADEELKAYVDKNLPLRDANDMLYAMESSRDYNPAPGLEKIKCKLVAINFADDLINPDDLPILQNNIKRVPHGKAIIFPESQQTRGHQTHTWPVVWQHHLAKLLRDTERK